jgi:hypothetical protein
VDFAWGALGTARTSSVAKGVGEWCSFLVGDVGRLPLAEVAFCVINDDGCLHHLAPEQWTSYKDGVLRVSRGGTVARIKVFSRNCEYYVGHGGDGVSGWQGGSRQSITLVELRPG